LGPDDNGDTVPIITPKAPQVKKVDQFDKEPSYLKRHLLTAMPTPSPITPFQSKVRFGTSIQISKDQSITIENSNCLVDQESSVKR